MLALAALCVSLAGSPSLRDLADDALLSEWLYRVPHRMASGVADTGAIGVNAEWEAGRSQAWFIEDQRYGADFVQAGLIRGDAALVAQGWKILEWGFRRQQRNGGFTGTGDPFHSTSLFVEAAARALVLTSQSSTPDSAKLMATYLPKLEAAAFWLTEPDVAARGQLGNAPYTHRRWLLAAALGEAAAALRASGGAWRTNANDLDRIASVYAEQGLRLQRDDGLNPEKGGGDTSYQGLGILMAERYMATCPSTEMQGRVRSMIVRGLGWLTKRIDAQGLVASSHDTRTGVEASRSGKTKAIDYKTMIQALLCASTLTDDRTYRDVATRLAKDRGWIH